MKKFLLPLALAVLATIDTESCDPETVALAEQGLEKMNEIMTNGTNYEFGDCTLVIRDNADLISDADELDIVNNLSHYCNQVEVDLLLMTTNEVGLSSMSPGVTYAQMYLPADSEDWICLTYDMRRNCYSMWYNGDAATRACGGTHTDAIFNEGNKYFKDDEYGDGLEAMAEMCLKNITGSKTGKHSLP